MITITVFTPSYNRSKTLHRVFDSLVAQTYQNIEWIVVDDGSIDNTEELVKAWQQQALFPINYYRFKKNQGKHIAHNKALELANGFFFTVIDSDDAIQVYALECIVSKWNSLTGEKQSNVCGIYAHACNNFGYRNTPHIVSDFVTDDVEMLFKYSMTGDRWWVRKTEVMREFRFPTNFKGSHIPEGIIWRKIGEKYKILLIDDPLYIIYLDDGASLSRKKRTLQDSAKYLSLENIDLLNHYFFSQFWNNPSFFIKRIFIFIVYSFYHANPIKQWASLNTPIFLICLVLLPVGAVAGILFPIYKWLKKN